MSSFQDQQQMQENSAENALNHPLCANPLQQDAFLQLVLLRQLFQMKTRDEPQMRLAVGSRMASAQAVISQGTILNIDLVSGRISLP